MCTHMTHVCIEKKIIASHDHGGHVNGGYHLIRPDKLALAVVGPRLREFKPGPAEKNHLRGLGP